MRVPRTAQKSADIPHIDFKEITEKPQSLNRMWYVKHGIWKTQYQKGKVSLGDINLII